MNAHKRQTKGHIDFRTIAFPSDRISIGHLRSAYPVDFDQERPGFFASGKPLELRALLGVERVLARKAFDAEMGRPNNDPENDRRELIRLLVEDYKLFGIATGLEHTSQLVRDFEAAAQAQAQKFLGKQV